MASPLKRSYFKRKKPSVLRLLCPKKAPIRKSRMRGQTNNNATSSTVAAAADLKKNSLHQPSVSPTSSSLNKEEDHSLVMFEHDTNGIESFSPLTSCSPPPQDLTCLVRVPHRAQLELNNDTASPHGNNDDNYDDDDPWHHQPDSQELMPPPVFHGEVLFTGRNSRSASSNEDEQVRGRKRRNTRSSSRSSTVILSDDETIETDAKERMANYLKRSPSKQLKRPGDDCLGGLSGLSRASSRSTVIFSSSSESL